jgi:ABC-type nitrate/sulfonate/bicarbonate transport system permease component
MNRLWRFLQSIWLVALMLVIWEVATRAADDAVFPPPSKIIPALHTLWFNGPWSHVFLNGDALDDFSASLGHIFGAWFIAIVLGLALGSTIGRSQVVGDFVDPILQFVRALPAPALIPFFLVVFHGGASLQIAVITFGVVWPILLATVEGVRGVDPLHLDTAQVFGIGRVRRTISIILPGAMPKIFAGLRVSLEFALILMVIAELVDSTSGIGARMIGAERDFEFTTVWSGIVLLGLLGLLFNGVFLRIQRHFLSWHTGARRHDPSEI